MHCLVLHQIKTVSSVVQVYVVNLSISVFELTSKPNKTKKKMNNGYDQLINWFQLNSLFASCLRM